MLGAVQIHACIVRQTTVYKLQFYCFEQCFYLINTFVYFLQESNSDEDVSFISKELNVQDTETGGQGLLIYFIIDISRVAPSVPQKMFFV